MLYKVTPMMAPPMAAKVKKPREPGQLPRKKRRSAVYDHEGHEVLITLMCLKCKSIKPLMQFGLRKMADGAIRNQPWCRGCRSGASSAKPAIKEVASEVASIEPAVAGGEAASVETAEVEAAPVEAAEVETAEVEVLQSGELAAAEVEAEEPLIALVSTEEADPVSDQQPENAPSSNV